MARIRVGEVYLYKFSRTETGDPILANIESDDEYAKAAEAFDVVLDNARKAEAAGDTSGIKISINNQIFLQNKQNKMEI